MVQYLAKRIGRSILTLFVIVTLVFCLLRLMPVEGYFANYEKMTEAQIQAGLQSMGLLDPLPVQIGLDLCLGHFFVVCKVAFHRHEPQQAEHQRHNDEQGQNGAPDAFCEILHHSRAPLFSL